MTNCPICNKPTLPSEKQPQPSLHAYSTKFECGTQIVQAFTSHEYDFEKRCDNLSNKTSLEKLFFPDELKIIYSDMRTVTSPMSIFLAGPTPRDKDTKGWREDAIDYLKSINFKGYVYIPERSDGWNFNFEYKEQIEWEEEALIKASVILFWIPRELEKMPGFTTNIEWGYWTARKPQKLILGAPKDAPKMDYLRYYADKLNIPSFKKLNKALDAAVEKLEYEAKRNF
jgi:hypothetical protein